MLIALRNVKMISFHPTAGRQDHPATGFRAVPVTELERIARCAMRCVWSPIIWREGRRLEANFLECFWCVYDFEDPAFTLAQAINAFCDTKHVITTSRNHRLPKADAPAMDRFRVIVPWAEPISDLRTYRYNMTCEAKRYPMDDSCKDGARLFFPSREVVSINDDPDAYAQPVRYDVPHDFELEGASVPKDVSRMRAERIISPFADQWLKHEIPLGVRNKYVFGMTKDLTYAGYGLAEIRELLLASPTYRGRTFTHQHKRKFEEATRNGWRAATRAMAAEQRQKQGGA